MIEINNLDMLNDDNMDENKILKRDKIVDMNKHVSICI